jgi:endogenous inhibitor of DNA gyrase (YacG/DUF329 family)
MSEPSPHRCPSCDKPVSVDGETYPFCSERCRLVDLGRWLDEKYRVKQQAAEQSNDEGS